MRAQESKWQRFKDVVYNVAYDTAGCLVDLMECFARVMSERRYYGKIRYGDIILYPEPVSIAISPSVGRAVLPMYPILT